VIKIKEGVLPQWYEGTCGHCRCEFMASVYEVRYSDHGSTYATCPTCSNEVYGLKHKDWNS
jgi:hypothetical protein